MMKTESLWTQRYLPGLSLNWQGRSDGRPNTIRFHERIECVDLTRGFDFPKNKRSFTLLGFECDEGIKRNQGRTGAAQGPLAIRHAMAGLPLNIDDEAIYDVGDVTCEDGNLEETQAALGELVALLIKEGTFPILLGGGHEIVWGHYLGLFKSYTPLDMAMINFDSHYDLRPISIEGKSNSGTSYLQIAQAQAKAGLPFDYTCIGIQRLGNTAALFKEAASLKVKTIEAETLILQGAERSFPTIDSILQRRKHIFLSICMDVFSTAYAPGVSAPQPLGLHPWHVIPLLRRIIQSGKVIGFNIAEVSPPLDRDNITARLAASLIALAIETKVHI